MSSAFRLIRYDALPTTNEVVKEAIRAGEPEGLVVSALRQTAGYGRQGRTWESPYGGLYQSFLLRPAVPSEQLSTIALVVALAVRDALIGLLEDVAEGVLSDAGIPAHAIVGNPAHAIQVKWPNDVVWGHRASMSPQKLCGISSEAINGALCVGVGVNVFVPAGGVELQGKNAPAYLSEFFFDGPLYVGDAGLSDEQRLLLDALSEKLTNCLAARYAQWSAQGFAAVLDVYRACSSLTGRAVEIVSRTGAHMAYGSVVGIDDSGRLLLQDEAGAVKAVSSGEAHIRDIGR